MKPSADLSTPRLKRRYWRRIRQAWRYRASASRHNLYFDRQEAERAERAAEFAKAELKRRGHFVP